ncbi:DNA alkylation repair protein [Candidatus Microgenomates bacterium]|nr:DNA alkylation repair protein [Candidatus Microgenomates bacterium]
MSDIKKIEKEIEKFKSPKKAKILGRFFKTGKGEYGEGQIFLGAKTADKRKLAKQYRELTFKELQSLLNSKIHDYRFVALVILDLKFQKANEEIRKKIAKFYLKNTKNINNWDLVDISAPKILGFYLLDKDRSVLHQLAKSKNLWEKRIAVLSTFAFIREKQFSDTLKIAKILLNDKHDLIHKAVGWMLREVGKKDRAVEERFLKKHYQTMPRTMLRYAIERFDRSKRDFYLGR